ncbi:MAG: helix-hairpin-helix domain-containing protein [Candidatus Berkiella sp.]
MAFKHLINLNPNAIKLYEKLCRKASQKHDPCVLDVFMSAIYFMNGKGSKPWWHFTEERKKILRESHQTKLNFI